MELAGKYLGKKETGYTPDVFPNQKLMQYMHEQTKDPELKSALLEFQYPFKLSDLQNSSYSPKTKQTILNAINSSIRWYCIPEH